MKHVPKVVVSGLVVGAFALTPAATVSAAEKILEAESMTREYGTQEVWADSTASGGSKRILWNNGAAFGTLQASGDFTQIDIRAKGDHYGSAYPKVDVWVDRVFIKTISLDSVNWKTYSVTGNWTAGDHRFYLEYTNDSSYRGVIPDSAVAVNTTTPTPTPPSEPTEPTPAPVPAVLPVPYISQYSPAGADSSYISGSANCGPTSMAMIARYYNYAPGATMTDAQLVTHFAVADGKPTGATDANGIKAMAALMGKPVVHRLGADLTFVDQSLAAGKPLAARGNFSTVRHYIVITGKNTLGNYTVNDPASSSRKTPTPTQLKSFINNHPEGAFFSIG